MYDIAMFQFYNMSTHAVHLKSARSVCCALVQRLCGSATVHPYQTLFHEQHFAARNEDLPV